MRVANRRKHTVSPLVAPASCRHIFVLVLVLVIVIDANPSTSAGTGYDWALFSFLIQHCVSLGSCATLTELGLGDVIWILNNWENFLTLMAHCQGLDCVKVKKGDGAP
jgi:hypothetical protein